MLKQKRVRKHRSVRKFLKGTSMRPRLAVFKSDKHIYGQIIDDQKHLTLVSESDLKLTGPKLDKAQKVGEALAKKALKQDIKKVVFDRGGFIFHGRIKALAEAARGGGLEF